MTKWVKCSIIRLERVCPMLCWNSLYINIGPLFHFMCILSLNTPVHRMCTVYISLSVRYVCGCLFVRAEPPLPTSDPPKKKPKMAKSKSLIMDLSEIVEDEYIPMEPIYTEPPQEELSQLNSASK